MLHRVIIDFINQVYITVIRFFNPVGDQQECVPHISQYIFRDVLSRIQFYHREIMNSRLVSFFFEYSACINKCPCAIRIILQCKFFLFSVLLQNKDTFIYTRFRSFRHRHSFQYILSYLVGTEVQYRQTVKTIERQRKHKKQRVQRNKPFHFLTDKADQHLPAFERSDCSKQQEYVLDKCLPISQHPSISKTPAVGHRIEDCQIQCQRCHKTHQHQRQRGSHCSPDTKEQKDTD